MIIKRIVLVWFSVATMCTVGVFYFNDVDSRWFAMISTMAISIILLPVLFLLAAVYHRFFNINKSELDEFRDPDDNAAPTR